jgi:hypothetical protein
MTTSLTSVLTAVFTVFGIITLALVMVDTLHGLVWRMMESKRDDGD